MSLHLYPAFIAAVLLSGAAAAQPATPARLDSCDSLAARLAYPDTAFTAVEAIAAGKLAVAGKPIAAHCRVLGQMHRRRGTDGRDYAVGFEMRLPLRWNGRLYYQANGGLDGVVETAQGSVGGGGPLDNALNMGFAVISSDAGHQGPTPDFGLDQQARLDYGYQAIGKLTPMAKALVRIAYGKAPDRSYIGGCSNGGRHTMVAAARYADQYDGYLVGNPGYRLPLAAVANIAGAKIYAGLADKAGDPGSAFTLAERGLVARSVLGKCDALDGVADGMVQDTRACQAAFDLGRDVPTCSSARDGNCLSAAQKAGIGAVFAGATTESGRRIYASFPYDAGLATPDWGFWEFGAPAALDAGAVRTVFQVPPDHPGGDGAAFIARASLGELLARVHATSPAYPESAMSFMTPPDAGKLAALARRGAKIMVYHGTSDAIFSSNDSAAWYEQLRAANGGDASHFARLYLVPGMNHCAGGPSTDQFDMLTPLVDWVENGNAPEAVVARVRGPGNPGGANADLPPGWPATRSRPLCPYPKVARYAGSGDAEQAASFSCR